MHATLMNGVASAVATCWHVLVISAAISLLVGCSTQRPLTGVDRQCYDALTSGVLHPPDLDIELCGARFGHDQPYLTTLREARRLLQEQERKEKAARDRATRQAMRTKQLAAAGLTEEELAARRRSFAQRCEAVMQRQPVLLLSPGAVSADVAIAQECRLAAQIFSETLLDPQLRRITCANFDFHGDLDLISALAAREYGCLPGAWSKARERALQRVRDGY